MTPEESEPDIAARGIDRRLLDAGPRPADDHLPGIPEGEAVTLEDLRRQKNEWYAHHAGRDSLGGLAERERETLADLGFAVRPRPLPAYYTAERHDWVSQQGWELRYLPETRERERQYAIGEGWVLFAGSVRDDTLFDRTIQGALLAADLRQAYQDLPFRPRRVDEWERVPEWLERFAPDYLSPFPGRIPEYPVQVASAQDADVLLGPAHNHPEGTQYLVMGPRGTSLLARRRERGLWTSNPRAGSALFEGGGMLLARRLDPTIPRRSPIDVIQAS